MQIEIKIDPSCTEPKIIVQTAVACLVGAGFAGSSVVWAAELLAGRRSVRRLNARLAQRQSSAPER